MDSQEQGYNHKRFQNVVDSNFDCRICGNVLKDPVQCRRNEDYYCTPCIVKYLTESSQTCPVCEESLTVKQLKEPSKLVANYLSSLKISCDYAARGCRDVVQLGNLKDHVEVCGFVPVRCSSAGCSMVISKRDKKHHEAQKCGFRKIRCETCGKSVPQKKVDTHGCALKKDMDEIKESLAEIKEQLAAMKKSTKKADRRYEAQEEVTSKMKTAIAFMNEEIKKLSAKQQPPVAKPRAPKAADIVVTGGYDGSSYLNSAEVLSGATNTWRRLPAMEHSRISPACFVYKNVFVVNGGFTGASSTDTMEKINVDQESDQWFAIPAKLPFNVNRHTSVFHDNRVVLVGGEEDGNVSDRIYEISMTSPYASKLVCRMAQPRAGHGAVLHNDNILIAGGRTTGHYKGSVDSVIAYDVKARTCKEMPALPFEVSQMAVVCHRDNLVVIGGQDKEGNALDKAFSYRIGTGECRMLPNMANKREACVAVVTANMIVVMGGRNEHKQYLNSVECFRFDRQVWEELAPMTKARMHATASVLA